MKLGPREIVAHNHCGQRAAVISDGNEVLRVGRTKMVAVDKIRMGARPEPRKQRMNSSRLDFIPSHVRDFERGIARLDRHYLSGDPAETLDRLELAAPIRHQLHPNADPEKWAR